MISTDNAVCVQLESRRLFWSILCGMFGGDRGQLVNTAALVAPSENIEHESRMAHFDILFGRPNTKSFVPAAKSFLQAELVLAV
jgi:hypothetical protein